MLVAIELSATFINKVGDFTCTLKTSSVEVQANEKNDKII